MRYLPGPVDPQKSSKNSKKMLLEMGVQGAAARAGRPGGAAPREEEKGGSGGQRPLGNILVFRMFHILVDATACTIVCFVFFTTVHGPIPYLVLGFVLFPVPCPVF